MSFALGDSPACFKYFHGIWIVNKTKGWERTPVCLQLLHKQIQALSSLSSSSELSSGKLSKTLCLMG